MTEPGVRSESLEPWVGREEREEDLLDLFHARAMAALLDREPAALSEGSALPPGWHWLYFRPVVRRSELGADGHRRLGTFLPPLPGARRMWAGGELILRDPLRVGDRVQRRSAIESIQEKGGRTGSLVFVTIRHHLETSRGPAVEEAQRLVYRIEEDGASGHRGEGRTEAADPAIDASRAEPAAWSESFTADAVTLFHFSALTYNGHRIHYDHPYTTGVLGFPGLVVHGPLLALLLLDGATRHGPGAPNRFRYRAVSPLFQGETFRVQGDAAEQG